MTDTIKLVYIGVRASRPKQRLVPHYAYAILEDPQNATLEQVEAAIPRFFLHQLYKCSVGSVIACEAEKDDERLTIKGKVTFLAMQIPDTTRFYLELKSEANLTMIQEERSEASAANRSILKAQLDPVRMTYSKISRSEKRALLAWMIEFITRG